MPSAGALACCSSLDSCLRCVKLNVSMHRLAGCGGPPRPVEGASISYSKSLLLPKDLLDAATFQTYSPCQQQALPNDAYRVLRASASHRHNPALSINASVVTDEVRGKWLVALPSRLMVCPIEKNGATEWIRLFLHLWGKTQYSRSGIEWSSRLHDIRECQVPSVTAFTDDRVAAMFACTSFTKVIVLRDPLERLLSGYLDKCAFGSALNGTRAGEATVLTSHCPGFFNKGSKQTTMEEATLHAPSFDRFVRRLHSSPALLSTDAHFRPQHQHCGMHTDLLPTIHYFIRMGSPKFYRSLDQLFERVGLDASVREQFFPERSASFHRTAAAEQVRRYYTPELVRLGMEMYAGDYAVLGPMGLRRRNVSGVW